MARAPFSITTSERTNTEAGSLPAFTNTRWIGRASAAPSATWITAPSPMNAVLSATATSSVGTSLPRCATRCGSPAASRLRHRADGEARFQIGKIGEFRHEGAIDEHDRARLDRSERGDRLPGARLRGRIGHARERLGVAHERAQVGIFPLLDAAVRQPFGLEAPESIFAQRSDRRRARKRALHRGEIRRQRGFGRSLDRADLDVHRNLTPPRPGIARSRWLRARAPAPCRRSSRCGPSRARAPRPARCSRAGAGSA